MAIQLGLKKINYGEFCLHHIFYKKINQVDLAELCDQVSEFIYNEGISLISNTISANLSFAKALLKAQKLTFGDVNWPETWLHNANNEQSISGYYSGISGSTVKTLAGENFITKIIESSHARYCFGGEITALKTKVDFTEQNKQIFETIAKALFISGLDGSNLTNTTYYLSSAANNYNELIKAYAIFFKSQAIEPELLPISSFIGSPNQHKSALQTTFTAIKPYNNQTQLKHYSLKKDWQCNVLKIESKGIALLNIGTFSHITNYRQPANAENQIIEIFTTIENMLANENLAWNNLVRAIAYFKTASDVKLFKQLCKDRKIPASPILIAESEFVANDICFDFEADFAKD